MSCGPLGETDPVVAAVCASSLSAAKMIESAAAAGLAARNQYGARSFNSAARLLKS